MLSRVQTQKHSGAFRQNAIRTVSAVGAHHLGLFHCYAYSRPGVAKLGL